MYKKDANQKWGMKSFYFTKWKISDGRRIMRAILDGDLKDSRQNIEVYGEYLYILQETFLCTLYETMATFPLLRDKSISFRV